MKAFGKVLFALTVCFVFATSAFATRFDVIAQVSRIRFQSPDNTLAPIWRDYWWFSLASPSPQPNCNTFGGEYVIVAPVEEKEALSLVLASKMAEREVMVTIDDTVTINGFCRLQYLTVL